MCVCVECVDFICESNQCNLLYFQMYTYSNTIPVAIGQAYLQAITSIFLSQMYFLLSYLMETQKPNGASPTNIIVLNSTDLISNERCS